MLIDKNARYPKRPVILEPCIFFGQLQYIFLIRLMPSLALGLKEKTTLILAAIRTCADARMKSENNIYYYSREGHLELVDMKCIQCLVGRVKDGSEWAIIDRSSGAVRPLFVNEDD
jgi:hypothetical protein